MCGIAGIVDLEGRRPVDEALLRKMNGSLRHRGPDGDGFFFEPGVGFGHRRLSIIDLAGGRQPLFNEDETVVVTYNGEIYNFRELERALVVRGHVFRTRCDTEVIVHAWEEWGPDCVHRFNGMFAFAIWDRRQQTLFLARDRLGIKPLYYTILPGGQLLFGSELKALLCSPEVPRKIDPTAVEDYFTFGYVPDPKTIFSNVFKLAPGHRATLVRGGGATFERYWDVPLDEAPLAGGDVHGVVEGLSSAVTSRLVSDVPLGAFLSGGIDSSAVVAMMRESNVSHLLTCSIGFDEPRYDESRFARIVASEKNTDHKSEVVETSDYDLLDRLAGLYDEPFADSSAIPTYRVCELARKHVTVVLSGDGGDESFIGYRRYRLFAMEERLRSMFPGSLRRPLFGALGRFYPKLDWAPRVFRGKTTFQALARSSMEAYLHGVSVCSGETRSGLFSTDLRRELDGYTSAEVFASHVAAKRFEDPLRMIQYLDFKTYLPGDILAKVDRASMAHSLEVRVPFLDYEYVEQIARYPTACKLNRGQGKLILKRALEPYLPREILYRSKMGFAVPLDIWFRRSLRERMASTLTCGPLIDSGLFEASFLSDMIDRHQSGKRDHSSELWALLMFDGMLRNLDRYDEPTDALMARGA